MELKSILKVFNEAELPAAEGIYGGQRGKTLAGTVEHPSEKIRVRLVTFEPGTKAKLHWHLIEKFYYVISGRAVITDIEGRTHDITAGSVVYAPPGIAGAHSWDIKEKLQLIGFAAHTDPERSIQFDVDLDTKHSSVSLEQLSRMQAINIKSSFY